MLSAIDLLERGIEALAAVDVDALTEAELHEFTVTSLRLRDRLAAVSVPVVARWDATGSVICASSRTAP